MKLTPPAKPPKVLPIIEPLYFRLLLKLLNAPSMPPLLVNKLEPKLLKESPVPFIDFDKSE